MSSRYEIVNKPGQVKFIHVTDRRTFKECRRKYRFQVIERLAPNDAASKVDALWLGQGVHKALEGLYLAKQAAGPTFDARSFDIMAPWEEYCRSKKEVPDEETQLLARGMLEGYRDYSAVADRDWEIVGVELPMEYKVPGTRITLRGTVDLLIKWKGRLWIVDHKTAARLPDAKHLELDDQMTAYLWLARTMGIQVHGCVYNVLRKKLPTIPEVLKSNGELSQNKSIDTTHGVYLKAILDNCLNPDKYEDMLNMLAHKGNTFYVREHVIRNGKELDNFGIDIVHELREMSSKNTYHYPNPRMECSWCPFQTMCKMEREGSDVNYIRQSLYRVRGDDER